MKQNKASLISSKHRQTNPKLATPMDDTRLSSHSSIPLLSRLDHLEFIMKYLERNQKWGSKACAEKQCMPLDFAVKEAYSKGSLLDRVASLEHRLFQLWLERDSSRSSQPLSRASKQIASGESSSSQMSKGEICYPLPTFDNLSNQAKKAISDHNHVNKLEIQEKSEKLQNQKRNIGSAPKQQVGKNRSSSNKKEKKSKGGKKRILPCWTHFKLLGC